MPTPDLGTVRSEDLVDTARTLELHRQAVARGVVADGEAGRLRVVSAAEHARSIGSRNPCGLFAAIVGRGLWKFVTTADEDSASRRLRAHRRAGEVPQPRPSLPVMPSPLVPSGPGLSVDADLLRAVRAALGGRGDPYLTLRCRSDGWPRERYDRAVAELDGRSRGRASVPEHPLAAGVKGLDWVLSRLGRSSPSDQGGVRP